MKSHVLNLILFSFCVSFFFAVLYRDTRKERIRHFLKWFLIFVVSGFVLGWVMYAFPLDPYF